MAAPWLAQNVPHDTAVDLPVSDHLELVSLVTIESGLLARARQDTNTNLRDRFRQRLLDVPPQRRPNV